MISLFLLLQCRCKVYTRIYCVKKMNYILEYTVISRIIWLCSFSNILNTQSSSNKNSMKQINILSGKTTIYWKKTFQYFEKHNYYIHYIFLSYFIYLNTLLVLEYDLIYSRWGKTQVGLFFIKERIQHLKQLRDFKLNSSLRSI